MTRVLPSRSVVHDVPLTRQHSPNVTATHERAYDELRQCLRWDFAFTCAFCLLHEAQVCPHGAAGSGQFWIEHLEPQSTHPALRNVYANVLYVCRRCNLARGGRPRVGRDGRSLLDPTLTAWAQHFRYENDEIVPSSRDAHYTASTYDVNAPPKVALRRERFEAIEEAMEVLEDAPSLLAEVMEGISMLPPDKQRKRLGIAELLHKSIANARTSLLRLSAAPADASTECACELPRCELRDAVVASLTTLQFSTGTH